MHGAIYLGYKSEGPLEQRSVKVSKLLLKFTEILTAIGIPATVVARPSSLHVLFSVPVVAFISLGLIHFELAKKSQLKSFLASCAYLISMIVRAAAGLFPVLLPSLGTRGESLTIASCVSPPHTLLVGLAWWSVGMLFAISYFVIVYWMFRGKVPTDESGYGH